MMRNVKIMSMQNNEPDREKGRIRRVHILAAVLAVLLVMAGAGGVRFYLETKEMHERIARGEFDDYHNQPHNEFGAPAVYYRSDLERIAGVRMKESAAKVQGISCSRYRSSGAVHEEYDHMTFYIFDKEKEAAEALSKMKENSFAKITDEGGNYVRGWIRGVMDAEVEEYFYVNGNLMVAAVVTVADETARDKNDLTPRIRGGGEEALRIIDLIKENF